MYSIVCDRVFVRPLFSVFGDLPVGPLWGRSVREDGERTVSKGVHEERCHQQFTA